MVLLLLVGCARGQEGTNIDTPVAHARGDLKSVPRGTEIRRDEATGTVTFLKGTSLSVALEEDPSFREVQTANAHAEVATRFISAYRSFFRLGDPARELLVQSVTSDDLGMTHVRLRQTYAGLPVWGAEILVHLDAANHVHLVTGRYVPTPSHVDPHAKLKRDDALRAVADHLGFAGGECRNCQSELVIGVPTNTAPRLAYRVLTQVSLTEGWAVLVDANTGEIVERVSTVYTSDAVAPRKGTKSLDVVPPLHE